MKAQYESRGESALYRNTQPQTAHVTPVQPASSVAQTGGLPIPYGTQATPWSYPGLPVAGQTPDPLSGPGSFPPLGQNVGGTGGLLGSLGNIRQLIDRMGGLDGVLENVSKIQKIMNTVQQMAPMMKLLMNNGKSATAASKWDETDEYVPRRRRRRRRRRSGSSRRKAAARRKRS
jgi:hypothetical protein